MATILILFRNLQKNSLSCREHGTLQTCYPLWSSQVFQTEVSNFSIARYVKFMKKDLNHTDLGILILVSLNVHQNKNFDFHEWFLRKYFFFILIFPIPSPGLMSYIHQGTYICTNLYLHIIIMLHNKYCIISTAGSWEDNFVSLVLFTFVGRIIRWKFNYNRCTTDPKSSLSRWQSEVKIYFMR